jgi:hypothetical protein
MEGHQIVHASSCQLILRPIESMSEEEKKQYHLKGIYGCDSEDEQEVRQKCLADMFEYLVSIGICINPDWKEKGWVVYSNELEEK